MSRNIIIFDFDGTIVDSGTNIVDAVNHTRVQMGLDVLEGSYILENLNKDNINPAEIFYDAPSFNAKHRELFEGFYEDNCAFNISLYDKVGYYLEEFKRQGFLMSIATNGKSKFANKMLSSLGIDGYFDMVVGSDGVALPKPNPEMLLKIIDAFDIDEDSNVLMVGDSIKDVKAARAIGVISAVAEWGFGEHKPLGDKNLATTDELSWIIDFFKD